MWYEPHLKLIGSFHGVARYGAPRNARGLGTRHSATPWMLNKPPVPRDARPEATVHAARGRNRAHGARYAEKSTILWFLEGSKKFELRAELKVLTITALSDWPNVFYGQCRP